MIDKYIVPGLPLGFSNKNCFDVALWVFEGDLAYYAKCPNCDETWYSKPTNYCPNCGCMMLNKDAAVKRYENILDDLNGKMRKEEEENG